MYATNGLVEVCVLEAEHRLMLLRVVLQTPNIGPFRGLAAGQEWVNFGQDFLAA